MIFNAGLFCHLEYTNAFDLVYLAQLMQLFPRICAILLDLVLRILCLKIFWSGTATKLIRRRIFLISIISIFLKISLVYWLWSLLKILQISLALQDRNRILII